MVSKSMRCAAKAAEREAAVDNAAALDDAQDLAAEDVPSAADAEALSSASYMQRHVVIHYC
uniref:Uncharacterized protein n=1 Tax=Peronospora matthiolae TaxID=2874970 RepID=A0AAV1U1C8_9STRA